MGCVSTKLESKVPPSLLELFAALRLTKSEVYRLYQIFSRADMDGSGSVDIVELLTLLDIERTSFTEQVFTVFDGDGSGKVDFKEFVLAVWNYCTIGHSSLDMFTFDIYDYDKSGILSLQEVRKMLKDIFGKNHMHDSKVKSIENELNKLDQSGITVEDLKKFAKNHQHLLFPVFKLQNHLQEIILGRRFWKKASERRIQLSKGKYVKMSELMRLHLDKGLYDKVMKDAAKLNPKAAMVIRNTGTAHNKHNSSQGHPPHDCHPVGILPPPASPHDNSHSPKGGHHPHSPHMRTGHSTYHQHGSSPNNHQHSLHRNSHHGHNGHHHHHGVVLKSTETAADEGRHHHDHTLHATGHHYSDGKIYVSE